MQNVHFTPPELAKIFRVNVSTIKRWVDKGYLDAQITSGGHRRVTRKQLAKFLEKYPKYASTSYIINRILKQQDETFSMSWKTYYRALHTKNSAEAEHIIEQAYISNIPIPDILDTIVTPTLVHIGTEWEQGHISIYEEHRMSFIVRMHLFRLSEFIAEQHGTPKRKALLACVTDEQHEMSLQMLALIFQVHGWQTHILGINISANELLKAAQELKPHIIGLSKMYTGTDSSQYLHLVARYGKKNKTQILYGGNGWSKKLKNTTWPKSSFIKYISNLSQLDLFLSKKH